MGAMTMARILALALIFASGCSDSTTGVAQGPITFTLKNDSGAPLYAQWIDSRPAIFKLEIQAEGSSSWSAAAWSQPGCISRCGDDNKGKGCVIACGPSFLGVRRIGAGATVDAVWSGKLYPIDDKHCSDASCYSERNPDAGKYRMTVCAFDGFTCPQSEPNCMPDDTTPINAQTSGSEKCASEELVVPFAGSAIELSIK